MLAPPSLILLLLLEMVLLTHLEMASVNMEENLAGSLLEDNKSVRLIRGSVPGADTFLGVHFYFWNGLCSLYYDPVTLCVKLFSSHFCSEEVKNLKLVLGLGLILCSTTHMYSFLYLSLSQVTSSIVWCFGLYVLFKRLKNLWVGLGKLNFIFNVLITWNKCINLMFLSGFLFWNHTFDLHRKTRAMNPHCLLSINPPSHSLPTCQGYFLHVRLLGYKKSMPQSMLLKWAGSK